MSWHLLVSEVVCVPSRAFRLSRGRSSLPVCGSVKMRGLGDDLRLLGVCQRHLDDVDPELTRAVRIFRRVAVGTIGQLFRLTNKAGFPEM